MSLILDALKRAERERAMGAQPAPAAPTQAPIPTASSRRLTIGIYILCVLLGVAITAIIWMLMQSHGRSAASSATASLPTAPIAAKPSVPTLDGNKAAPGNAAPGENEVPAAPESAAASADPAPDSAADANAKPTLVVDNKVSSLDDLTGDKPAGSGVAPVLRTRVGPSGLASGERPNRLPSAKPATPLPSAIITKTPSGVTYIHPSGTSVPPALFAKPTVSTAEPAAPPRGAADSAKAGQVAVSSAAAPTPPDSTQFQEMPEGYRAQFPTVSMDIHVYDDNPAKRFVMVGGRRYHEGETLAAGPHLLQIVPEGMVLEWQGKRVVYAMPH